MNIPILFWGGRWRLFKRFPVDTFCIWFLSPKEMCFFLIALFAILIGNLSSKVISTINFHMVFRCKLAVVSLLLLRPAFEFISYVKSVVRNFWTALGKTEILSLRSCKKLEQMSLSHAFCRFRLFNSYTIEIFKEFFK